MNNGVVVSINCCEYHFLAEKGIDCKKKKKKGFRFVNDVISIEGDIWGLTFLIEAEKYDFLIICPPPPHFKLCSHSGNTHT